MSRFRGRSRLAMLSLRCPVRDAATGRDGLTLSRIALVRLSLLPPTVRGYRNGTRSMPKRTPSPAAGQKNPERDSRNMIPATDPRIWHHT